MKNIFALFTAMLILILCGCGPNENEFKAVYLPGISNDHDTSSPVIYVLHNTNERDALAASVENAQVKEALSAYNDKFFNKRIVFVLEVTRSSFGHQYAVEKVVQDGDNITFYLKDEHNHLGVPGAGKMTILVEMDRSWDCVPENIRIEYQ